MRRSPGESKDRSDPSPRGQRSHGKLGERERSAAIGTCFHAPINHGRVTDDAQRAPIRVGCRDQAFELEVVEPPLLCDCVPNYQPVHGLARKQLETRTRELIACQPQLAQRTSDRVHRICEVHQPEFHRRAGSSP